MGDTFKITVTTLTLLLSPVVICKCSYQRFTSGNISKVTITEKTLPIGGKTDQFMVFGQDTNGNKIELENTDAWFKGKFDAASLQNKIEIGKTYDMETYGWRKPFFSMFPNIIDVKEVTPSGSSRKNEEAADIRLTSKERELILFLRKQERQR